MKLRRLALVVLPTFAVVAVVACGDDETASPGNPDAGALPPRNDSSAPTDGATQQDAARPDANDAATCPIGFDATVTAAMKVTADDYLRLWVNGVLVDDKQTTWGTVDTVTVTLFRSPLRKNVIAVEARNAFNAGGYDRGLLVDLGFDAGADAGPDSGVPNVVTDPTWRIIGESTDGGIPDGGLPDGGAQGVAAWFAPTFDDSKWNAATDEGAHGMSPWGSVFGTSSARWLWSYDSAAAGSKPTNEIVYFRKGFFLDTKGVPRDTQPACP
jgi:hypothetical protein